MSVPDVASTTAAGSNAPVASLRARVERLVCDAGDDDESRLRKILFTWGMIAVVPAGLLWGVLLVAFDLPAAAVFPFAYSALTVVDLALLVRLRRFAVFQRAQVLMILLLPFGLQLVLGGFGASGAVILWSFIAVLMSVLFGSDREARAWFAAFVGLVLIAAALQPYLPEPGNIGEGRATALFTLNLVAVSTLALVVLGSFMRDRRRLRELERAYLDQDLMLRQSEKLATLGTLAAGVAHELNNPAAAAARGVDRLGELRVELDRVHRDTTARLDPVLADGLARLDALVAAGAERVVSLSPLQRSDREEAMADWLRAQGDDDPWQTAAALVDLGASADEVRSAVEGVPYEHVPALVGWAARSGAARKLLAEIGAGSGRISQIVGAMRSYSYLDRAPVLEVDVVEGLESTLILLASRLRDVEIERRYASHVPRIEAYGSELNQVWTNIIDNAVDAMGGAGTITLRVSGTDDGDGGVLVAITDTGPGMEPAVASRVFDAFFTTKPPGAGTGLGLNISHNIIVGKHGGTIAVDSEGAGTTFRIRLPPTPSGEAPGVRSAGPAQPPSDR